MTDLITIPVLQTRRLGHSRVEPLSQLLVLPTQLDLALLPVATLILELAARWEHRDQNTLFPTTSDGARDYKKEQPRNVCLPPHYPVQGTGQTLLSVTLQRHLCSPFKSSPFWVGWTCSVPHTGLLWLFIFSVWRPRFSPLLSTPLYALA